MTTSIYSDEIDGALHKAEEAARDLKTRSVTIEGQTKQIPTPFPSPPDWRDCPIYFLMIDRFNNPEHPPNSTLGDPPMAWNQRYDFRQGGTFKGIKEQLGYIKSLGAGAIWLTPVLKNPNPEWRWNYHGYGAQDFLAVDERFGSDGTRETAERELVELVEAAHAWGLYVILDVVLNHSARVFDYVRGGSSFESIKDPAIMAAPLGQELDIRWLNGSGFPQSDWQNQLPDSANLSPDDAIWPGDLQNPAFFRRRGEKLTDDPGLDGFVRGDFGVMRQLVVEYDARPQGQEDLLNKYGPNPVLSILLRAYQYLIAKYDFDGFRIDTVKYVSPKAIQTFGNAIREYALILGKRNFFTFGEIYDDENTIAAFVGRNGGNTEGFGIDAALDFPLFFALSKAAKGSGNVESIRQVYEARKQAEKELLSSHGEAGRFFVTFLDNHDQNERFNHPATPQEQVTLGLAALFSLQGIPCLYYGTEQGLQGTVDQHGNADLRSLESSREALWGKLPLAFDRQHHIYKQIKMLTNLRAEEPALRYGRLYFRQVSGNGSDFGHSRGPGGILAFSRILANQEVLVVANTHHRPFSGHVLLDLNTNRDRPNMKVAYSNQGTTSVRKIEIINNARFFENDRLVGSGTTAAITVELKAMEVHIYVREKTVS